MWLQCDWGEGPKVGGRRTQLFCAWLSWSRFRVVLLASDQTLGTLVSCVDATLRRIGGVPTYLLTDNPKTVTIDRVAGVPVRHLDIVAAGRHYGCTVETCEPFDPESKGGAEHTVKIAKADLVATTANLLPVYSSFVELADACSQWCARINARPHRETGAAPAERLRIECQHLHILPAEPHAIALGEERLVYRAPTYPRAASACHITEQYANNAVEADHGRLKVRLRPMRGLKHLRSARVISAGHAFIQNLRRGHYELALDLDPNHRIPATFTELALAI
jgi:hypothetical protein